MIKRLTYTYNNNISEVFSSDNRRVEQGPQQKQEIATGSVAQTLDHDSMFGTEFGALGLDMIFGGVAGISCDMVFDAIDIYDEFIRDRHPKQQMIPVPQPDPRLWVPTPGMAIAA